MRAYLNLNRPCAQQIKGETFLSQSDNKCHLYFAFKNMNGQVDVHKSTLTVVHDFSLSSNSDPIHYLRL